MLTSFFVYTGLVTMFTYIVLIFEIYIFIYIYIYDVCLLHLSLHVLFIFFLYTHISYLLYEIFLFLFHTKMPWWVLFKVFQKYRLSKSFLLWILFLQSFSRVCVRINFIVFNKWVWVEWFMTSLICSFVCCDFVMDCQRGRLFRHMWFDVRNEFQIRIS